MKASREQREASSEADSKARLDKWLWAARFFKTRSLAAEAIETGKVEVNGERAKRAKQIQPGDTVRVRLGPYQHVIKVLGISERRGPASVAAQLYQETAQSIAARQALHAQMKASQPSFGYESGRPTKKDRREIEKLRRRTAED